MSTTMHSVFIVAIASIVTIAIRFFPFIIFPEDKKLPSMLIYFSKVLPAAIMGMLVVYCFKNLNLLEAPHGMPELIATVVVVASYLWKKNYLLSIGAGTVLYMILVQLIFV